MSSGKTVYSKWNLHNMFDAMAPTDQATRDKLFVGRENELNTISELLHARDRAILLYGSFGSGKTMLMRTTLDKLANLPNKPFIAAYTGYQPELGFKRCAMNGIVDVLLDDDDINQINQRVLLEDLNHQMIDQTLRRIRRALSHKRIIIAVDDIERGADIAAVERILNDIRTLRDYGYSVMVPGHPNTVTGHLQSASYGVLLPIELKQLNTQELRQVMYKHLELGRTESRQDFYPFTDEAAMNIARRLSRPDNTIREFIIACLHLLETAVHNCDTMISSDDVNRLWPMILQRILAAVDDRDHAVRILKLISENGGRISEDVDLPVIEHILNKPAGFMDAVKELRKLVDLGLLVEENDGTKLSVRINQSIVHQEFIEELYKRGIPTDYEYFFKPDRKVTDNKFSQELYNIRYDLTEIKGGVKDIVKNQQQLYQHFKQSEQAILTTIVARLDEQDALLTDAILTAVEIETLTVAELEKKLIAIQQNLTLFSQQPTVQTPYRQEVQQVIAAVGEPGLDVRHRLKLTIPLIPILLSYEGEYEFNIRANLEAIWQELRAWGRVREAN